jgi:transposase
VTSLRQLIGELTTEITMLSEVLADLLAGHRGYLVIQRLPGIGPVLTAVIIAEIGDVTRFRTPGQLASCAGLIPGHRVSGIPVIAEAACGTAPLWALSCRTYGRPRRDFRPLPTQTADE